MLSRWSAGKLLILVRTTSGLGIVGFLLFHLNAGEVISVAGSADWLMVLVAIFGLTVVQLLGATTWKLLTAQLCGISLRWFDAARIHYAAQAAGSLTPANVGADIYRVYALKDGVKWARALLPIGVQRNTSFLGLAFLGLMASLALPLPGVLGEVLAVAAGLSITGIIVVGLGTSSWWRRLGTVRILRRVVPSLGGVNLGVRAIQRSLATGVLLGLAFHIISIGFTYMLVLAVGGEAGLVQTLAALTLTRLAISVPFTFNGLGVQESAAALLFPSIGLTAEMGIAVVLLSRLALLVTIAIGGISLGARPKQFEGAGSTQLVTGTH